MLGLDTPTASLLMNEFAKHRWTVRKCNMFNHCRFWWGYFTTTVTAKIIPNGWFEIPNFIIQCLERVAKDRVQKEIKVQVALSWPGNTNTLKSNYNIVTCKEEIVWKRTQATRWSAIMAKLVCVNKCFCKLLCSVLVAIHDFERLWVCCLLVTGAEQDLLEHNLIPKGFADSLL